MRGLGLGLSANVNLEHQWVFSNTGVISLPVGLTFACSSTRTAQTPASTLLRNIGANVPCANTSGAQVEPQATNCVPISENFASSYWTVSGGTKNSTSALDPAGQNTGCDFHMFVSRSGQPRQYGINWDFPFGVLPTTSVDSLF